MRIIFTGFKKINWLTKRRLRKIAFTWLADHLVEINSVTEREACLSRLSRFTLNVFPTTAKSLRYPASFRTSDTGRLSNMIPWEVVGLNVIDLFIIDDRSDMMFASALMALTHGLAHALLYCLDPLARAKYTVFDDSGHKPGDIGNWSTVGVHNKTSAIDKTVQHANREIPNNHIYYLETYRFLGRWKKVYYRVYDFRDDIRR